VRDADPTSEAKEIQNHLGRIDYAATSDSTGLAHRERDLESPRNLLQFLCFWAENENPSEVSVSQLSNETLSCRLGSELISGDGK
jgi:hypothetical protein